MPELPEVETIKNQLLKKVKGKTIKNIRVKDYQKRIQGNLKNILAPILNIQRKAKLLVFNLANNYSFLIHLKLTGQLIYFPSPPQTPRFAKVIFTFKDNSQLIFNDFRKFGFLKIMKTKDLEKYFQKQNYGPDPLKITLAQFQKLLQKRPRSKIKPTLMDQTLLAGLGNIYAQEACFLAHISPLRIVSTLTKAEIKKLYSAIQKILKASLKHQGTSFDTTYVTLAGQPGGFDPYLKVYHRDKCPRCKTKLKVIKLGGRSTYYCPHCQK